MGIGGVARVGVVVPTYKRPDLLAECLNSLVRQSYGDFVVYVCDNAAEEACEDIVRALSDARFRYIPRVKNLGILGNVSASFKSVPNDLIIEVDDDDVLLPDALRLLVEPFDRYPDLALSFGDIVTVDERGRPRVMTRREAAALEMRRLGPGYYAEFRDFAIRGYITAAAVLMRREVCAEATFWPAMGTAYDIYLMLRAARLGGGAYNVGADITKYRIHATADSAQNYLTQLRSAEFVRILSLEGATSAERRLLLEELANIRVEQMMTYHRAGKYREACASAGRMLLRSPGLRAVLRWFVRVRLRTWMLALKRPLGWRAGRPRHTR